jgi:hypothetical protein
MKKGVLTQRTPALPLIELGELTASLGFHPEFTQISLQKRNPIAF